MIRTGSVLKGSNLSLRLVWSAEYLGGKPADILPSLFLEI